MIDYDMLEITTAITEGLAMIRDDNVCNMLDRSCVCTYAAEIDGLVFVADFCADLEDLSRMDRAKNWMAALKSLERKAR
jgi:hypothetical protein